MLRNRGGEGDGWEATSPLLSDRSDDEEGHESTAALLDRAATPSSNDGRADHQSGGVRGRRFWAAWVGFFILGTVNNLPYVIVASAADAIVKRYCVENLIGAITWANVAFGFAAKGLNAGLLLETPYAVRVWGMVVVMSIGLLVVAFSASFGLALAGIVLAGAACSFGEGVFLGYLKEFDELLVNGWSSGTGMAGVGGAALYIGYVAAGLSLKQIFLCTVPWMAAYLAAFHLLCHPNRPRGPRFHAIGSSPPDGTSTGPAVTSTSLNGGESSPRRFERFWRCLKQCRWLTLNLCLVYVFEYVISAGLAAKVLDLKSGCRYTSEADCLQGHECVWTNSTAARACKGEAEGTCSASAFDMQHAYAIFSFCYQAGVLVSRSSLQVAPVSRVEVLTVLQFGNLSLWLVQAKYKIISSVRVLFALMFFVGLLGGASYVNVFHQLLKGRHIPDQDREFTIQLAALFGPTLGITIAAIVVIVLDQTALRST